MAAAAHHLSSWLRPSLRSVKHALPAEGRCQATYSLQGTLCPWATCSLARPPATQAITHPGHQRSSSSATPWRCGQCVQTPPVQTPARRCGCRALGRSSELLLTRVVGQQVLAQPSPPCPSACPHLCLSPAAPTWPSSLAMHPNSTHSGQQPHKQQHCTMR